jgi:hypothetical protein
MLLSGRSLMTSATSAVPNVANFPRNARPNLTEYLSERPEMTSHGGKPRKAKTMKENNTYENKIS